MLKPDGYVQVWMPDGEVQERDTYWCGHCGGHRHILPGKTPYATCKQCMNFICAWCYKLLPERGCVVVEEMLLRQERAIRHRLQWEQNFRAMR